MRELALAKRAAKKAGALLMGHLGRLRDVRYKSVRDPVSEADTGSEALIAGMIRQAFPGDGFWELRLKPWDTAAGTLIVREAGGLVTDYKGDAFTLEMQEILATNGTIHNEMMRVLKG